MAETVGFVRNNKIRRSLSKQLQSRFDASKDRLQFGQDYRSEKRERFWTESEDQYNNDIGWQRGDDVTADIVNVNISFSTINTLVPFISDQSPNFKIEPYSGDATVETARLLQAYLNRVWESDQLNGQRHLGDATFDYAVTGDGYVFVGYEIEKQEQFDFAGDPIKGRELEVAKFFVERTSPWDVWIDPYSDGIHNARWVCRRILVPVKEILGSDRYRVLNPDMFSGAFQDVQRDDRRRVSELNAPDERGFAAIYEFYDTVDRFMVAWSDVDDSTPIRYVEQITAPIVQLGNYRIPSSPYHMGELENLRSLQEELNKTRSQMITHRRRNVMKWMVRPDQLDEDAMRAIQSSSVNDVIPVKGNAPFDTLVQPIVPQQLGQDSYMVSDIIRNDINEVSGVNEYLRGVPGDIRRTATEASIIEGSANIRTRHKLNQVEDAARQVGQLLLNITSDVIPETDFEELKLFITGREADDLNRLFGQEANTDIVFTPTPETFVGKYVVFVEGGSAELRDPALNEKKWKEMFTLLSSSLPLFVQLGISDAVPNMRRVMELWFDAAGITDVNSMFADDAQRRAQLEGQQQQQQLAAGPGQAPPGVGGVAAGAVEGLPTLPGEGREETQGRPEEAPNSLNSGIIPPQQGVGVRE